MSETAFLSAVADFLAGAGLAPAPALLGPAEPAGAGELPAVVLSLEDLDRPRSGLGERTTLITGGALRRQIAIDLADPVLPGHPEVDLLDGARTGLTLHHGGLVRADGSEGPLGPADLTVTVDGGARTVIPAGPPDADEVRADPAEGRLLFGSALPPAGTVAVAYFLGQWEQRVSRLAGTLRVDVCAADAGDVATLSGAVLDALTGPSARTALAVLLGLSVREVGSIGLAELPAPGQGGPPGGSRRYRVRTQRLAFTWERIVDEAESSGGVIARVQVDSDVDGAGAEEMIIA